ncbi:C40 family peptidase [Solibacillus sp. Sa1YVA6]|uniref:C40 family peptidase n=2 Tax=Solibacillus merdavium TaxID=2762218 RepID=A0ABR8XP39_9BACL|nr:C40 family peptidase [Solibacillus merdavium]
MCMIRRILFQIVIICIFMATATGVGYANTFPDVPSDTKLSEELNVLSDFGGIAIIPNEPFRVNDAITRYEAAEMIVRTMQIDYEASPIPTYEDISEDDPRMPIIAAITELRIMTGFEGKFNPDAKLTRAQAVKILAQAFGLSGQAPITYKDIPKNHSGSNAIQAFVANQILFPAKNEKFNPNAVMTRGNFASYTARIIEPTLRPSEPEQPVFESCAKDTNKKRYVVDVAVTNFWNKPNQARAVDYPSTKDPVEMQKWVSSLSLSQKKWLVGRTDTQALYGDEVALLETKGKWQRVAAKDQYVPYLKEGYPGWVPKTHIVATNKNYDDCAIAIITSQKAHLLEEDAKTKFLQISYATILPIIEEDAKYYYVETPSNGVKLLKKGDAKSYTAYSKVPKPTAQTIIKEAKRYLDLPYLWAGTSSWGYDCSGILYAVFRSHGIMIPRDSFYQATGGKAVAKKDLKPGDLVFFAYNGGKGKVYHVGLYVGEGKMLHAPHYASKVKIESMNNGAYKKNYSGARRYL